MNLTWQVRYQNLYAVNCWIVARFPIYSSAQFHHLHFASLNLLFLFIIINGPIQPF